MRLRLTFLLGCMIFGGSALPLLADTVTDHFVFSYHEQTVVFDLPASGPYSIDPFDSSVHISGSVQGSVNGTPTSLSSILLSSTQEGGGLGVNYKLDGVNYSPLLYGPQLYGYADDPTQYVIQEGVFSLYDFLSGDLGSVTITQAPSAVTPEPSTLLLLGSGLCGATLRNRWSR